MGLPKAAKKGIFSIEGDWSPDLRKHYSVMAGLRLLKEAAARGADCVLRGAGCFSRWLNIAIRNFDDQLGLP